MKKILIDLYKVKNRYSGLGQFSLQFAKCISEDYCHEFEFHFLVPRNFEYEFSPLIKLKRANLVFKYWKSSHEQYDLWHSLYQFYSYAPPQAFNHLLTIHDLNFQKEKIGAKQDKYRSRLEAELNSANHVTAISNYTKGQIEETYPNDGTPIEVIHNGVDYLPDISPTRPDVKIGDKFFFSISHFSKKKNFETLIPMMKYFPEYKLVLAGNHETEYGSYIKSQIASLGLEKQIKLVGKIPNSEKVYYMQLCDAFLFPSLIEGFGMPPVEAMQFGKPVFLSMFSSLPEIGGDVAYYFSDFDPKNMAHFIKYSLIDFQNDEYILSKNIKAHAAQFSWKNSMMNYIALYRKMLQ